MIKIEKVFISLITLTGLGIFICLLISTYQVDKERERQTNAKLIREYSMCAERLYFAERKVEAVRYALCTFTCNQYQYEPKIVANMMQLDGLTAFYYSYMPDLTCPCDSLIRFHIRTAYNTPE